MDCSWLSNIDWKYLFSTLIGLITLLLVWLNYKRGIIDVKMFIRSSIIFPVKLKMVKQRFFSI